MPGRKSEDCTRSTQVGRPGDLSKGAFVERVALRAGRYGAKFEGSQLDEWIKQGLTPAGSRGPNIGRRPNFTYGCRHYRRTLQLVRLHASGVTDRDALLVQLFLKRYSVRPDEVREALLVEFKKARAKLNAQIRSTFADRAGEIPAGRKRQFRNQLGDLDDRLQIAGYVIPDDILLAAGRAARDPGNWPLRGKSAKEPPLGSTQPILQELFSTLIGLSGGMLSHDDEHETQIERLIRSSDANEYEQARTIFEIMKGALWKTELIAQDNTAANEAFQAAFAAFSTREFSAFNLVAALKIAAQKQF